MAGQSFFFYDLETSGISARSNRIMQFAGQRTDMDLQPVGEPVNVFIKLSPDILPDAGAILVTGITPQQTLADGVTEAEFLQRFNNDVAVPGTIFVGYNNVRFDDEFMRFTLYRNFYDAYEWQWKDNRTRWDLLDVVRMTRALRPDGVNWPFAPDGKSTNRLELLTSVNKLDHANAHDALSDVNATIAVAKLIKQKQPDLFGYLLNMRDKKKVAALVNAGQPFVYSSGKYASEFEKTTVVARLGDHPQKQAALVYDLRQNPDDFASLPFKELAARASWTRDQNAPPRLPVKTLQYNHCPAVAPLGVFDDASQKRLQLSLKTIHENYKKLQAAPEFIENVIKIIASQEKAKQTELTTNEFTVDAQLYDGFVGDADKNTMSAVRAAGPDEINTAKFRFQDKRLAALLPLYKARNFSENLTQDERAAWEKFRQEQLLGGGEASRAATFGKQLAALAAGHIDENKTYLLEELQLYAESILPIDYDA